MNDAAPFAELYQEEVYNIPSRTLVIIDKNWEIVSDDEKLLLQKILGSVRLSLAMIHLISKKELSIREVEASKPERIIAFGTSVKEITSLYQFSTIEGIPVICADSLKDLDDARKKNLWHGLRQMFNL